jgi:hypothetical protein
MAYMRVYGQDKVVVFWGKSKFVDHYNTNQFSLLRYQIVKSYQ